MPQSIPAGLTQEHVLRTLADLDAGIDHPFGPSTGYELVHDGKRYAPKAVIGLACRYSIGRVLRPDEFSGGEAPGQANFVLRKLGFTVIRKGEEIEEEKPPPKDWSELEVIIKSLGDANTAIRSQAVNSLARRVKEPEVLTALLAAEQTQTGRVRSAIFAALAKADDPKATAAIIKGMTDEDVLIRASAVQAARNCKGEDVTKTLIKALDDPQYVVASEACSILGSLKSKEAVPKLRALLASNSYQMRVTAISALKMMNAITEVEAALARFGAGYETSPADLEILSKAKDKQTVAKLIELLKFPNRSYSVEQVAKFLGEIGDAQAVEPLMNAFQYGSSASIEIPRALGRLGDKRAIELLAKALRQPNISSSRKQVIFESLRLLVDDDARSRRSQQTSEEKLSPVEQLASLDKSLKNVEGLFKNDDPLGWRISAWLHQRRADMLAKTNRDEAASKEMASARELYEKVLSADPQNADVALELAKILLASHPPNWLVLKPHEMHSSGGATLTLLDDDSVLASGKNPLGDSYMIKAKVPEATAFSTIRLEALTHASLPNGGPGRDSGRDRGVFDMVEFKVLARSPGSDVLPVSLSGAVADYFLKRIPITVNRWNIGGGQRTSRTASYKVDSPKELIKGTDLEFQLRFSANKIWPNQNLGRFRLSISGDPSATEREQQHAQALKTTDPWLKLKLARAYALAGNPAKTARSDKQK